MPSINEARIAAKMDAFIKAQIAKAEKFADEQIAKNMSPPDLEHPDRECEVKSGALPVSAGLMAVNYGTARIALRVLPRLGKEIIEDQIVKIIASGLGTLYKALVKKRFPVIGDISGMVTGIKLDIDINKHLATSLTEILGCAPNEFDKNPMRKALNDKMRKVKERGKVEPRRVKKVHTRRP